jgi:DNA recombination protein RmuC
MEWIIVVAFIILAAALVGLMLKISGQVNDRLNQMNQSLLEANKIIGQNLGGATQMFGSVQEKMGVLVATNRQIIDISKDIVSLQELLRAPKFRGQMGEVLLEGLLAQVLPKDFYQIQYRFKGGDAVDAVIRLGGRLVPVDAKFSLENFQRMIASGDDTSKNAFRKKFIQDTKARIDEIASKYILPAENTYDFGLMYIPAENVYYEVAITEDLFSYSAQRKVFPVSPNTFYVYLQVICLGLKGLKVEENALAILKTLSGMTVEMAKLRDDFNVLGSHLSNAGQKFEDSHKRLERFSEKLSNIQDYTQDGS